ncbi:MAG: hypothetical protein KAU46_00385 [Candidatus Aminicenantes bacterium]|nr:hypothetical protein [Candidatus Aminicenantes bacterium]
MTDVFQTVDDWIAQIKRGETPLLLEQFLRENFPNLSPGGKYEVFIIYRYDDQGSFTSSCLFWVWAHLCELEAFLLPSLNDTAGLFALGSNGLRYLHHKQEEVAGILRDEGRPLDKYDPFVLASFFAESLGRNRNKDHGVLRSEDHLAHYGDYYKLNLKEWEKCRRQFTAPSITKVIDGWNLEFFSVYGWMHEKKHLIRHNFLVTPDLKIYSGTQVLSKKIFKRTPHYMY